MIKRSALHPPRSTHQSLPSPVPSPARDHVPTPDSPPISNRLTSCHRPFLSLLFRLRLTPSEPSSLLILTLITSGCCFEKLVNKSPKNLASWPESGVLHLGPYTTNGICISRCMRVPGFKKQLLNVKQT